MGLPASGKSTVARELNNALGQLGTRCMVVDADDLADFKIMPERGNFSLEARLQRAEMLTNLICWLEPQFECLLVAASGQPRKAREIFSKNIKTFTSVYLKADIDQCKKRDYKGIYGLKDVVGLDLPFDEPLENDIIIEIKEMMPLEIASLILERIQD